MNYAIFAMMLPLAFAFAAATEEPKVSIAISQYVHRREPQGPTLQNADRFRIINNKVYAWMRLKKHLPGKFIHHRWYFQDQLMDNIRMPIGAQLGRIYSVKTIKPPYVGVWRVEVRQDDQTLLETRYFLIEILGGEMFVTVLERNMV